MATMIRRIGYCSNSVQTTRRRNKLGRRMCLVWTQLFDWHYIGTCTRNLVSPNTRLDCREIQHYFDFAHWGLPRERCLEALAASKHCLGVHSDRGQNPDLLFHGDLFGCSGLLWQHPFCTPSNQHSLWVALCHDLFPRLFECHLLLDCRFVSQGQGRFLSCLWDATVRPGNSPGFIGRETGTRASRCWHGSRGETNCTTSANKVGTNGLGKTYRVHCRLLAILVGVWCGTQAFRWRRNRRCAEASCNIHKGGRWICTKFHGIGRNSRGAGNDSFIVYTMIDPVSIELFSSLLVLVFTVFMHLLLWLGGLNWMWPSSDSDLNQDSKNRSTNTLVWYCAGWSSSYNLF